jgi:hypothetical protein
MKPLVLLLAGILLSSPAFTQEKKPRNAYEVSIGFGMLVYQSVYSLQNGFGIEAAVRSRIAGPVDWQAGLRLGFNPALPEVFGRVLLIQEVGVWNPDIGLELGITTRARFNEGSALLRETREAMQIGLGVFYMSIHAAPLSFRIKEKWRLSTLEVDFGTHFADFGRTLRGQLTILSISRKF